MNKMEAVRCSSFHTENDLTFNLYVDCVCHAKLSLLKIRIA